MSEEFSTTAYGNDSEIFCCSVSSDHYISAWPDDASELQLTRCSILHNNSTCVHVRERTCRCLPWVEKMLRTFARVATNNILSKVDLTLWGPRLLRGFNDVLQSRFLEDGPISKTIPAEISKDGGTGEIARGHYGVAFGGLQASAESGRSRHYLRMSSVPRPTDRSRHTHIMDPSSPRSSVMEDHRFVLSSHCDL
jgi:hypothetical protein